MPPTSVRSPVDDATLAHACLSGDEQALLVLRQGHYERLVSLAIHRGATHAEAEEIVADVWSELISPNSGKTPLLEKYNSKSPLTAWLNTVVIHRFIDRRRRAKLFIDLTPEAIHETMEKAAARKEGKRSVDDDLLHILRETVAEAFQACPPETLVMMKLIYLHGVSQREIGRVWHWHESKVSRHLDNAQKEIRRAMLEKIKRTDGFLKLEWDDFLDLCEYTPELFNA